MSLAFLQVDLAAGNAVSSVAPASGATLTPRNGWRVATSFGDLAAEKSAVDNAVGVADVSHITKIELQGDLRYELGSATRVGGGWRCPVTATRALVLGAAADVPDGAIDLDVTGAFGALVIAGPLAREAFARFCALDLRDSKLPVAGFRPGSVARTPGFVLREADQRFLMLFGAAYGAYMWEIVVDAATRLGGRAVGLDAIEEVVVDA
jgi:glycine cleavage system aminomethyltransferase T